MATIKDIATALGISRGTVDRALHDREGVSEDVKARVLAKATELGYKPNRAGRLLAVSRTPKTIGILLPSVSNPFFDEVKRGMSDAGEEYKDMGFTLRLEEVKGFDEKDHLAALKTLSFSQALLLATLDSEQILNYLETLSVPIAAVNTDLPRRLFYVGPSYAEKGLLNAGLLSLSGNNIKRNIVVVLGSDAMRGHREAVKGFYEGLKQRKVEYNLVAECRCNDDEEVAYREVKKVLERREDVNTLFIVSSGAKGAIDAASGRDILAFASDEIPSVKQLVKEGKLAWTIGQDPYTQGYQGVKKLCEYFIDGETPDSLLTTHIVKLRENI